MVAGAPVLSDDAVALRPVARDDAEAIVEAVRGSIEHLMPWMPWASPDYGPDDVGLFLHQVDAGAERAFVIADQRSGRLCGLCGLNRIDGDNRTANLGFWLRADATGRGFATRATRLLLLHSLTRLAFERIEIVASVENVPSVRVAERLDLHDEGIRRRAVRLHDRQHDVSVFAAFRDDVDRLETDDTSPPPRFASPACGAHERPAG